MKKIFKKNQIIIAALAVMIAAAGYLHYSGKIFSSADTTQETGNDLAGKELLDISDEDSGAEIASTDGEVDGTPGEAVLTSAEASNVVAQAKVSREQVRAKNKETLQGLIDDANISDEQKADAIAQMVAMTEMAEAETTIETLLASKGFTEAVVSLSADSADVVVNSSDLSDARRAQIEDIVTRKSDIDAANIVITPIHTGDNNGENTAQ